MREKVKAVHEHFAFLISAHDRRLVDVSGHEISECRYICIESGIVQQRAPGALRAAEIEGAASTGGVEGVDTRLAHFATEAHLMFAGSVRERIRKMPRNVVPPGVGCESGILESRNRNERGTRQIGRVDAGV